MLTATLLCVLGCLGSQDTTSFEDRLLLTLPEGVRIIDGVVSPNGRAAAYFVNKGVWASFVVVDGKKGEVFDHVDRPEFSQDGKTIAYFASKGGKRFAVVNGKKGEEFLWAESLIFSPDGKAVMYKARNTENRWFRVVGEKKGEEFDDVDSGVFSPDGSTVAYVASRKDKRFVVLGDKKGEEFHLVGRPTFSPDGKTIAYDAYTSPSKPKNRCVMVGEKRVVDDLDYVLGCAFTPSGKLFYAANRGGEFGNDDFGQMRIFPPRGGKWFIVMGDDQHDVPSGVESLEWGPKIAPDGKTPVYVAKKGDQVCVVVGDQPGPLFGGIGGMAFTSDGKSLAYIAHLFGPRESYKEQRLVIDGKVGEERFLDMDLRMRMSPDGKVIALRTSGKDGMQVRIGAHNSDFYQIVDDLILSPDGRKVAFCARKGSEIWWKVLQAK